MSSPIRPSHVTKVKSATLPPEVFEAFNELITERWDGHSAKVMQADAATAIASKLNIEVGEVYARHLLDVEDVYEAAGWRVEYDKPGYCESYEPSFTFRKGRSR